MAALGLSWSMVDPRSMADSRVIPKDNRNASSLQVPNYDQSSSLPPASPIMATSPSFFNTTFSSWSFNSPPASPVALPPSKKTDDNAIYRSPSPVQLDSDSKTSSMELSGSHRTRRKSKAAQRRKTKSVAQHSQLPNDSQTTNSVLPNTARRTAGIIAPSRSNSLEVGEHINKLLNEEEVQEAVHVLNDAVKYVDIANISPQKTNELGPTYSKILLNLCEPNVLKLVMSISKTNDIVDSVIWRLFSKVVASGYTLDKTVYLTLANLFAKYDHLDLAQQALYLLPRKLWDTAIYKMAITLHLLHEPKQIQEVESLLSDYGRPYVEVANPIAPARLPPIRIDTPLMKEVSDEDKQMMWIFYQTSLDDTEWARAKDTYEAHGAEIKEQQEKKQVEVSNQRRRSIFERAMEGTSKLLQQQQNMETFRESEMIQSDNAMIYTAVCNQQYEYGWQTFIGMGDNVDRHTTRMVMRLCRCAFNAAPVTNVSTRFQWEQRAWSVYSRFMFSKHVDTRRQESHAFIRDILFICANSTEQGRNIKYRKALKVYTLLERLDHMLGDEYVMMPIFCILLEACCAVPETIVYYSDQAILLWKKMRDAHMRWRDEPVAPSQSFGWMLTLFCLQSGSIAKFYETTKYIEDVQVSPSIVAPIQYFHDTFLKCKCSDEESCYFKGYLYKDTTVGPDAVVAEPDSHDIVINEMGFCQDNVQSTESVDAPKYSDPIAHLRNAYKKNITISDKNAAHVAKFAALGPAADREHVYQTMHYSERKAKALVRHCFMASKSQLRV
ncbi:hypothetical protein NQZ79_g2028 [Umbelopsis isabellina]|nr:hypothetical protein NQZ79_g2028 [Umbelopsis isabellina]